MANIPGNNNPKPNNKPNNKANNKANNKSKGAKPPSPESLSYNKNTPMLIMVAVFLFFVMFHLLRAQKYKEDSLKQKIDAEIRKKLYYSDDYY